TCGQSGGYAALLTTVASHGYVVIASNSRWTDSAPTDNVQLRTLDYAKTLNEDPDSIYYQRLDMDNIGASGHSQGSMATIHSAPDPRVKALITWNGDPSNDKPFLYVTANRDTESRTVKSVTKQVDEATQPGAWLFYHKVLWTGGFVTGHLVLMEQPDRVVDAAVAWWNYWLKGDQEALKMFVGPDCSLCNQDEDFEYGLNSLFP
ncbi:MAG: hypothetical protein GY847_18655, partial [Proteobacteria bacterium]|nr:hypothetical protein [Pseudomonadota bacterium]